MSTLTPRGRARRTALLNATADLVARRGFHSVGIAEIGAAAGVTGSAIYRHFANKEHMLVALIERVVDELLDGARVAIAGAATDHEALRALIAAHVDFALRERAIIAVYDQEIHNLPDADRRRLRRQQRVYTELWIDVVQRVRRELERPEAAAMVHGVFGLLNSVSDYETRAPREQLRSLLAEMAVAAVGAPAPEPTRGAAG